VAITGPNFSPYPFAALRRVSRRDAALESLLAQWVAGRPLGERSARLAGGPVRVRLVGLAAGELDPYAAQAEVRIAGVAITLHAASAAIRALAQTLLGGPEELDAPRELTAAEQAIWSLVIAAAIADTGVPAEVWPLIQVARAPRAGELAIELAVDLGGVPLTVVAVCPPELAVKAPPARPLPRWTFEVPIVIARCALTRRDVAALAVRDVVVAERALALELGDGQIALAATPGAIEATVATGYGRRPMLDDAHVEVTVQLGTTRMTLRQLAELAVGQIVQLNRPLAGPFEVRAQGRLIGHGELIDVDGELGVRIVSIVQE